MTRTITRHELRLLRSYEGAPSSDELLAALRADLKTAPAHWTPTIQRLADVVAALDAQGFTALTRMLSVPPHRLDDDNEVLTIK